MKNISALILLILLSIPATAQQYRKVVTEITDKPISELLAAVDSFFTKKADRFAMSFFVISNGAGSANIAGGHEISNNIIVCVAEYDEYPVTRAFSAGPFFRPKFLKGKDLKDRYGIQIEHGAAAKRQLSHLTIYLNKVVIE